MIDPTIACFREEFDRFFSLIEKQIDVCPDSLWKQNAGGYPFWQQMLHVIACVELYALQEGEASRQTRYDESVVMLSRLPQKEMSKEDMRSLACDMKELAHAFIASQTTASLTARHSRMSRLLGTDRTNQHALIGLVRHACYHLGCCDALLREHGFSGVY